jgi:hypothetical protein
MALRVINSGIKGNHKNVNMVTAISSSDLLVLVIPVMLTYSLRCVTELRETFPWFPQNIMAWTFKAF